MKKNSMCITNDCYNDKEYGNKITYWQDKWGNERFNSPLLDLCLFCRIDKDRERASNESRS